jgi:membrane fusion protein, multidrug efflux system
MSSEAKSLRPARFEKLGKPMSGRMKISVELAAPTHRIKERQAACVLFAALLSFLSGCESDKPTAAGPPEVEVVEVTQKDVPITREWVATLSGLVNADIRAQVSGYLVKQNYTNGTFVKKGARLFQLDSRPFQALLDQATGNLQQARADLERAEAQLGKTQLDVDRFTPLVKLHAVSQQELDNATQANLGAKAQVAAARAAIEGAQAASESAKLNLGFTSILSPIDGVAGIATAQVGNLVGPQSTTALTTVSTVNPILGNFTASEQEYLATMQASQKRSMNEDQILHQLEFTLELANGTIFPHKGKFYALDRQVDLRTGSILVQVSFPNSENMLRPGGFGKISTVVRVQKGALLVPQRAVTDVQGQYLVAVVGTDNKVNIRRVTTGERVGSMWIIDDGLKAGDRVVAEGTQKVREGISVNPKPFPMGSAVPVKTDKGAAN